MSQLRDKNFAKKDIAWLHAAAAFAIELSKDPNRKVGAVVVAPGNRLCSFGYNGLVAGMPETEENWSRPRKYELVRHAEINAMLIAPFDLRGSTIYSTLKPCHRCLGDALNCGIRAMVYMEDPVPFDGTDDNIFDEYANMLDDVRVYPRDNFMIMLLDMCKELNI